MEDIDSLNPADPDTLIRYNVSGNLTYRLYSTAGCGVSIYSIRICMGKTCATFTDIARSFDDAVSVYNLLLEGSVTPNVAAEILEDIMEML